MSEVKIGESNGEADDGDSVMDSEEKNCKYEHPVTLWSASALFTNDRKNRIAAIFGGASENRSIQAFTSFYDLDNNRWINYGLPKFESFGKQREIPFVSKSRWGHSATVCPPKGNNAYLIGGWDSSSQFSEVVHYNFEKNMVRPFQTKGNGPSPRAGHSTVAVGSSILLFGGACCEGGPYTYYNDLYFLDTVKGEWESIEIKGEKPAPRSQHNALIIGDVMIIVGGYCGKVVFNDVWCLHLKQKPLTWSKMRPSSAEPDSPPAMLGLTPTDFRVRASTHVAALLTYRENKATLFVGGMCDDARYWLLSLDFRKGTFKWSEMKCEKFAAKVPEIPRAPTFIVENVEEDEKLDEWRPVTQLSLFGGYYNISSEKLKGKTLPKHFSVSFQNIRSTVAL